MRTPRALAQPFVFHDSIQGAPGPSGPPGSQGPQGAQGSPGPQGAGGALGYYGSFYDTTTQTAASVTTAYPLEINSTAESNGVSITNDGNGDPTQITFANDGTYSIIFSVQFENNGNSEAHSSLWLRKNGTDEANSRSQWTVPKVHGGEPGAILGTVEYTMTLDAGDDLQVLWQTESTDIEIATIPAGTTPTTPVAPGIILSVAQVMYTQVGPQGPAGSQGSVGPQGVQGPQGPITGQLDGGLPDSTYGGILPLDAGGVS